MNNTEALEGRHDPQTSDSKNCVSKMNHLAGRGGHLIIFRCSVSSAPPLLDTLKSASISHMR